MTRDYAQRKTNTKRKRNSNRKTKSKSPFIPTWVSLLGGFAMGCFFCFLLILSDVEPEQSKHLVAKQSGGEEQTQSQSKERQWVFYNQLPEQEVVVPASAIKTSSSKIKAATQYLIQAGSFLRSEDAERRRAEIIMLGLDPKVQETTGGSGGRMFRVITGPYSTSSQLSKAREILISEGIDTLTRKLKP